MTIGQMKAQYVQELQDSYSVEEASRLFFWVAEKLLHKDKLIIKSALNESWSELNEQKWTFYSYLSELKEKVPIQYVLAEAHFYGEIYKVSPATLIPRPETEELVEWIVEDYKAKKSSKPLRVLDIGTGSGCIAIALKLELPSIDISALDISKEALLVAYDNADLHQVEVNFLEVDILTEALDEFEELDIIVSNPPYIKENEKSEMSEQVLAYEPLSALFVPDEDPLIFYRKILELAQLKLSQDGSLYFEVNQYLAAETLALCEFYFKEVILKEDLSGNARMIKSSQAKSL